MSHDVKNILIIILFAACSLLLFLLVLKSEGISLSEQDKRQIELFKKIHGLKESP